MKQSFKITGLRCPKCAEKVKSAIEGAALPGVKAVTVSFLAEKVTLELTSPLAETEISTIAALIRDTDPSFLLEM